MAEEQKSARVNNDGENGGEEVENENGLIVIPRDNIEFNIGTADG